MATNPPFENAPNAINIFIKLVNYRTRCLSSFARIVVTKYQRWPWTTEVCGLMVLEARSLEIKVSTGLGPREPVRENQFNASLLASGGWLAFLACLSLEASCQSPPPCSHSVLHV